VLNGSHFALVMNFHERSKPLQASATALHLLENPLCYPELLLPVKLERHASMRSISAKLKEQLGI